MKSQQKSGRAGKRRNNRNDDLSEVGERIAELAKERAGSIERFAHEIGANPETVRKWRNEKSVPSGRQLAAIARRYGVSTDWVLGVEGEDAQMDPGFYRRLLEDLEVCDSRFTREAVRRIIGEAWEVWDRLLQESAARLATEIQAKNAQRRGAMRENADAFNRGILRDFNPDGTKPPWWPPSESGPGVRKRRSASGAATVRVASQKG